MKLLIYSHFFAPSIGGVETIVQSLALGLAGLRDLNCSSEFEITLVTQTPAGHYGDSTLTFPRRPPAGPFFNSSGGSIAIRTSSMPPDQCWLT